MANIQKDVIVVGGGMIGAACALGLAQLGLQIQVIERAPLPQFSPDSPYDLRISAISAASVKLLQQLNAWQHIEKMRLNPYRTLETWEIEGFSTRFESRDLNLPELGFMIENNLIQLGLWQAFDVYPNLQTCTNIAIQSVQKCGQHWQCFLTNGECSVSYRCRWCQFTVTRHRRYWFNRSAISSKLYADFGGNETGRAGYYLATLYAFRSEGLFAIIRQ